MTEFDKKLIEKAEDFRRYDYRMVDVLIEIADTEEGAKRLRNVRNELMELVCDTVY